MAYYEKVLQPGEVIRFLGRLHWIIYARGLVSLALAIVLIGLGSGAIATAANGNQILIHAGTGAVSLDTDKTQILILVFRAGAALCAVYAVFCLLGAAIRRATTEIVVTDKRVLFKTGVFGRRTAEMNISKVETVDVLQGVVGRLLGFGAVLVRGTGSSLEPLIRVAAPIALRNAILAG